MPTRRPFGTSSEHPSPCACRATAKPYSLRSGTPTPPRRETPALDADDLPTADAESGRGLFLVAALSERWSCYTVDARGGKVVSARGQLVTARPTPLRQPLNTYVDQVVRKEQFLAANPDAHIAVDPDASPTSVGTARCRVARRSPHTSCARCSAGGGAGGADEPRRERPGARSTRCVVTLGFSLSRRDITEGDSSARPSAGRGGGLRGAQLGRSWSGEFQRGAGGIADGRGRAGADKRDDVRRLPAQPRQQHARTDTPRRLATVSAASGSAPRARDTPCTQGRRCPASPQARAVRQVIGRP